PPSAAFTACTIQSSCSSLSINHYVAGPHPRDLCLRGLSAARHWLQRLSAPSAALSASVCSPLACFGSALASATIRSVRGFVSLGAVRTLPLSRRAFSSNTCSLLNVSGGFWPQRPQGFERHRDHERRRPGQ